MPPPFLILHPNRPLRNVGCLLTSILLSFHCFHSSSCPLPRPWRFAFLCWDANKPPPPQGPTDSNPCRDFPAVCLVEVWELWWEICKSSCMYFLPGLVAENFREPFRFLVIYFLGFENRIFRPAFSLCKSESK